ncbi:MAG: FAD:protein FMN transferase [Candidatus Omnitrophica bacterium]|nr:FAD:protein FMN transferase [Candidatus Omnitrophota bacterium]
MFFLKKRALIKYDETNPYLGAAVRIHCFYDSKIDISPIIKQCWEKVGQVQLHMNVYARTLEGDLSKLNANGFEGVAVNQDVFHVIKESIEYSQLTKGAFDITTYPLVELWKKAGQQGKLPDEESLRSARDKVGYQNLELKKPNRVYFKKKGMKVDLGSPASGFVCDAIAQIFDKYKIKHYLVDGGGEIFCKGEDQGPKPWIIGIQDPFDKDKLYGVIKLKNKGVSTSGNYEKFYTIGKEKFSHIIDPRSGYPQKGAVSITVIAQTTQKANELSTALSVLGGQKGIELANSLKNVEAFVIEQKEGEVFYYQTKGFCCIRSV